MQSNFFLFLSKFGPWVFAPMVLLWKSINWKLKCQHFSFRHAY